MRRIALLGLLCVLLAGCGNKTGAKTLVQTTDTASSAQALQVLQIEAAPGSALRFNVKVLKSTSTRVRLVMTNSSDTTPHGIAIKGNGVQQTGKTVTGSTTPSNITATLKPGTYEFYCPVDGHEQAGMRGRLIVGAPA